MKKVLLVLISLFALLPAGAQVSTASLDPVGDSMAFERMRAKMDRIRRTEHRPTVAVVLSGGGAKGAAHVGVLRYLEELEIPIDAILGTSMGGLVAGLYALGNKAPYLDSLLTSMDWDLMLSDKIPQEYITYSDRIYKEKYLLSVPFHYSQEAFEAMTGIKPKDVDREITGMRSKKEKLGAAEKLPVNSFARSMPSGYVNGLNVNNMFSALSAGYQDSTDFLDLPIPFCCVAADMVTSKSKNWTSGSITEALRSTMSIPGLFDPVKTHGMVLVDGGTRNNFPVDLAREMGADYIIGVNLSDTKKGYNDINNLFDIVWTFIDMLGNEAYSKNIDACDVFIKPDLHEYNMLSFDTESIRIITDRGYAAALSKSDQLKALKAMMPDSKTTYRNEAADNILVDDVQLSVIAFDGVTDKESRYLLGKLKFRAGDKVGKAQIDDALAAVYATGAFESLTYKLLGDEAPYRLVFQCAKKPVHQLGVGFRADTETLIDLLLNVGLNAHKIEGARLDLAAKLGYNSYAEARFSYDMTRLPTFNVSAKVNRYMANIETGGIGFNLKYWGHKEDVYLSSMRLRKMDFKIGLRNRYFQVTNWYNDSHGEMSDDFIDSMGGDYGSAFFSGRTYTFDRAYFPMKGIDLNLDYECYVDKAMLTGGFNPGHIASIDFKGVVGMGTRAAFIFGLGARGLFNEDEDSYTSMMLGNFIGGSMRGRYFDQQMAFCGFGDALMVDNYLATASAAFRFRFGKSLYTTLEGGAFMSDNHLRTFIENPFGLIVPGASFELAYDTIAGPVRITTRWSGYTGNVGVFLSFGYDF